MDGMGSGVEVKEEVAAVEMVEGWLVLGWSPSMRSVYKETCEPNQQNQDRQLEDLRKGTRKGSCLYRAFAALINWPILKQQKRCMHEEVENHPGSDDPARAHPARETN